MNRRAEPERMQPVSRWRVLLGALLLAAAVLGVIVLAESLRHPPPADGAVPGPAEPDVPRAEVLCDEPRPREGQDRGARDMPTLTVDEVASSDLYDCPQTWDGLRVRFRGEVVGAVLDRADGAWVQLNDDVYAHALGPLPAHRGFRGGNAGVGVHLPHHVANEIVHVGGPGMHGDVLEVVGTFRRVDAETGEVAVIRATDGAVVDPGGVLREPPLDDRRRVAFVLAALAVAVVVGERVVARRR